MTEPRISTKAVEVKGVILPWERVERYGPSTTAWGVYIDKPPKGTVLDSGEVFVPLSDLYELAEQRRWDSSFGSSFSLTSYLAKLAVVKAGWAVEETRGGIHGTDALRTWLNTETGNDFELEEG